MRQRGAVVTGRANPSGETYTLVVVYGSTLDGKTFGFNSFTFEG